MKRQPPSQRRRQSGPAVALFPFLAVLVCTMGALILMLMLIARQARLQAAEVAAAERSAQQAHHAERLEEIRWRTKQLAAAREKTRAQVAEARLQVGHLEDHARRLRAELTRLETAWSELEQAGRDKAGTREQREAELARLRAAVDDARRRLDQARAHAERQAPSYAILPYAGRNGTRRRPVYVECRSDAIVIQPEGIRFGVADFDGPLGPGNPLAAAVRAMREYWVSRQLFNPDRDGEPYPLLVVRPDGVVAYYAAREALKSWENDYGYEMVGADWKLAFPDPDPALASVVQQAVAAARVEQQELIAAAPRTYRAPSKAKYRAAPGGGLMREGGADEEEEERYSLRSGARHFALNRPAGDGQPFPRSPEAGGAPSGARGGLSAEAAEERGADRLFAPRFEHSPRTAAGAVATAPQGSPASRDAGQRTTGSPDRPLPEGWVAGRPPRESLSEGAAAEGDPLRPGQWVPSAAQARYAAQAEDSDQAASRHVKPRKLAEMRGTDWALRNATHRAVPVTRPIRVTCYPDRLVVAAEPGAADRTIALGPATEQSIDAFVAAIWEHMDGWGIAGRNMYWRPLLRVSTAPGAEPRLADLKSLLEGSGLDIP